MQGDEELERVSILVYPVHRWWTLPAHFHGPGEQQHPRDNADFTNDYNFIRFKYAAVLATTQADFTSALISENNRVWCDGKWAYACTHIPSGSVLFGTDTFTDSKNQAASIIGHEQVHTTGAEECQAYQWESDHRFETGIYPCARPYDDSVNAYLFDNMCP